MIFSQNKLYKPLRYLLVFTAFLLIVLFLFLQLYIPKSLKNYLKQNPNWQGYKVKIDQVDYSLLYGFNFNNIEISDPKRNEKYIKINDLKLDVDFLGSIIKSKAVIELIQIDKIESSISQQLFKELTNLSAGSKTDAIDKQKTKTGFELEKLLINNFNIIYDKEYQFSLNDLIITLGDFEKLENISIDSNIKIFEKDFFLTSKIGRTNSAIKAAVDLQTPLLELPDNQDFKIPALNIKSNTTIDIKDEVVSSTVVNVFKNRNPAGKADIKLNYNKKNSALTINTVSAEIFDLIKLAARGQILNISDDPGFEVEAKVDNLNLEKLTKLITQRYGTELSGKIENNDFDITGSIKEGLDIKGQVVFDDFELKQDKDYFFFDELVLNSGLFLDTDKNVKTLNLSASSNSFAGGSFTLSTKTSFNKENSLLNGTLKAGNIDLSKMNFFKDIAQGNILNLNTKFKGDESRIELFSDISAKDISIKVSKDQTLNISELRSSNKVSNTIEFNNPSDESNDSSASNIDIKLNNLAYKNLIFEGFAINKGTFNAKAKKLFSQDIKFDLSLNGDSLENSLFNLNLGKVRLTAGADKDKSENIRGTILSSSGKYKDFRLSNLNSEFNYDNTNLSFLNINFNINDKSKAAIKEINLPVELDIPFPYKINLQKGTLISDENEFNIRGINLDLNSKENDIWTGKISISEADLFSVNLKKLSSLIFYSASGYRISRIKGNLFKGKLTGYLNSQNNNLKLSLNLLNPKILSKENVLIAEKWNLFYEGKFKSDDSLPTGKGNFGINNLYVEDYEEESKLNLKLDIISENETLSVKNGLINNGNGDVMLSFNSKVEKPFSEKRNLSYETEKMNLVEIKKFLNPYLPPVIRFGEITGDMNIKLNASDFPEDSTFTGYLDFGDINIKGDPFGTYFNLEHLNGRLNLNQDERELKSINEVISRHTKDYKQAYMYTNNLSRNEDSNVNIKKLEYGFFTLENVRLLMNIVKNKLTIKELSTNIFDGKLSSSGFYNFGDNKGKAGKFYFLFNDLSLKNITDSIPGTQGYISGKFNGIVSLVQKERKTSMLDGLFNFWTVGSKKEKRVVGKAFLERLGAKERLLLGSSKNYDKGGLHGYINNGVITFNELNISNSFLGLKDLNINVHNKRNSISVAHLLSVIRETARRSNTGSLDLQFEN